MKLTYRRENGDSVGPKVSTRGRAIVLAELAESLQAKAKAEGFGLFFSAECSPAERLLFQASTGIELP